MEPLAADTTLVVLALNHAIAVALWHCVTTLARAVNMHEQVEVSACDGSVSGQCQVCVQYLTLLNSEFVHLAPHHSGDSKSPPSHIIARAALT